MLSVVPLPQNLDHRAAQGVDVGDVCDFSVSLQRHEETLHLRVLKGVEHTNFFENRATEYSKAATQGDWDDAFD